MIPNYPLLPKPILLFLVVGCLFQCSNGQLVAQRHARGELVIPKASDVTWQGVDGEGETVELIPTDIWLPWKIRRVEGNRVFFQFDGQEVSCLARRVIPLAQAPAYFEKQLSLLPGNSWAHKSLGQSLVENGQQEASLAHFDKAFEQNPKDFGCMSWKGHAYWQLGEMDKAEECFRIVAGNTDYDPEMRMYRGLAYFSVENYQKALEQFDKSDLNTTMAMRLKADCYMEMQKPKEALPFYESWIESDPLDSMAYYKRGLFHFRQGAADAALADASVSLRLEPEYVNAFMLRGAILSRNRQFELALLDYDDALELEPSRPTLLEKRYQLLADMGRYKEAIEGVSQRIKLDDSFDWGYFQRSMFQGKLENYSAAIEDMSKAIKMDPNYPDYHIQRAKFYAQNRQTKECMEDHDRAIELEPENPRYYYERGRLRIRLGRYESGLNDLDKAVEGMPDNLGLLYARGMAYQELGNYDLALADLDNCRKIDSENPYIIREFVWLLATHPDNKKRDSRRALRWMTKAMAPQVVAEYEEAGGTQWTDPKFHSISAATFAANGKFEEAVMAQELAISLLEEVDADFSKRLELYKSKKPYVFDGGKWFEDF